MDKIIEILKELSGLEEVKEKEHLRNDLALDSFHMVTLMIAIEDVFQIELEESDLNPFQLNTVQDVVNLVEKYLEEQKVKGERYGTERDYVV